MPPHTLACFCVCSAAAPSPTCVPASTTCCSSGCSRTQYDILPSPTVLQEAGDWGQEGVRHGGELP